MNSREKGFLLLTSMLGDPQRRPLSAPQLRTLAKRALLLGSSPPDSELCPADLVALGYGKTMAQRIVDLLADVPVLEYYLERGKQLDCVPVTRVSADYPVILRKRLGLESPGCLWAKGDISLLEKQSGICARTLWNIGRWIQHPPVVTYWRILWHLY